MKMHNFPVQVGPLKGNARNNVPEGMPTSGHATERQSIGVTPIDPDGKTTMHIRIQQLIHL